MDELRRLLKWQTMKPELCLLLGLLSDSGGAHEMGFVEWSGCWIEVV